MPKTSVEKDSLPEKVRFKVLERDDCTCQNCGATLDTSHLHVHHRIPRSEGGSHDVENLETLCRRCHVHEHKVGVSEYAAAFEKVLQDSPVVTSRDLADRLDCSRETARAWLVSRFEEGLLDRRQVGGGAKVYYPPYREVTDGRNR